MASQEAGADITLKPAFGCLSDGQRSSVKRGASTEQAVMPAAFCVAGHDRLFSQPPGIFEATRVDARVGHSEQDVEAVGNTVGFVRGDMV